MSIPVRVICKQGHVIRCGEILQVNFETGIFTIFCPFCNEYHQTQFGVKTPPAKPLDLAGDATIEAQIEEKPATASGSSQSDKKGTPP